MPYAAHGDEVYQRILEILKDEFFLYSCLVYHTYPDKDGTRIFRPDRMTLQELCDLYELDLKNTYRRLKRLRTGQFSKSHNSERTKPMKSAWLYEDRSRNIIPLVGVKITSRIEIILKLKSVVFTPEIDIESVESTPESVDSTQSECKIYTKKGQKSVDSTPALKEVHSSFHNGLDITTTITDVVVDTDGHLSIFSLQECLLWAQKAHEQNGKVKDVHALANSAYKTGKMDAYIQATLYPEPIPELIYEDESDFESLELSLELETLSSEARKNALVIMRGMLRDQPLDDLQSMKDFYTPEDWQWLMNELAK